jgi:hypothetical protein
MLPTLMTRVVVGGGGLQQRQERPGEEERRLEVEVEHLVPGRAGELLQRRAPRGAGVVDEDVDPLLGAAHLRGQPDALGLGGEVRRDAGDVAVLPELGDGLRHGLGLAGGDVHRSARLQQPAGHHQPDAPGAAGHDGDLAGQVEQLHVVLRAVRTGLVAGPRTVTGGLS